MNEIVKTMFARGNNDGDLFIVCKNGKITCHSFIVCNACPVLKCMYNYALKQNHFLGANISIDLPLFSVECITYLISMLYDNTLAGEALFLDFVTKEISSDSSDKKYTLDTILLIEYIKAKDYLGISFGLVDLGPAKIGAAFAVDIIKTIPQLDIYEPLRKSLYKELYDNLHQIDPCSSRFSAIFEDQDLCKEVIKLYNAKIKELSHYVV